jgi:hypothetical protein
MEERVKLSRDSMAKELDAMEYRYIVGSQRYLVHTQLELVFVVGYVSQIMQRLATEHQQAIKSILRYIVGTSDFGLHYSTCPDTKYIVGYRDSNLASDIDTSKNNSGSETLFFLGKCLIS